MREAICDTSPIQYLHQIGCLYLLAEFYTLVIVPSAVADELEQGRARGIDLPDVHCLPWATIQVPKRMETPPSAVDLGHGEKQVLSLGIEIPGAVLILDEKLGRLCASTLGLPFTGTLGLILRAKLEGRVARVEPLLQELNSLGFRLSRGTQAAVLRQAGE